MNKIVSTNSIVQLKPVSADSHVMEPPDCYTTRIAAKYRDRAPHVVHDKEKGDLYIIEGMKRVIPIGILAAAGRGETNSMDSVYKFEDLARGGWNAKDRLIDMERDGVAAEILYPTVGMMICNHQDGDYKQACFDAYNIWLQEMVSEEPKRVFGIGQTAALSPEQLIKDFEKLKKMGFIGVMMPAFPVVEDYDHECYDPVWAKAVELNLPLSFHVLTGGDGNTLDSLKPGAHGGVRGPKINGFLGISRSCQDIIGVFIFSGVFDRFPKLKIVSVEADAGWAPHYAYRMNHVYSRHRMFAKGKELKRKPSEYFVDNIYLTFQDDKVAFDMVGAGLTEYLSPKNLLWASDYPHADSTWPRSQEVLWEQGRNLRYEDLKDIVHDNTVELYGLEL